MGGEHAEEAHEENGFFLRQARNIDHYLTLSRRVQQLDVSPHVDTQPSALAVQLFDLDGSVSLAYEEPLGLTATPLIAEEDFNGLLTGTTAQGGSVQKRGMLDESKWCAALCCSAWQMCPAAAVISTAAQMWSDSRCAMSV